MDGVRAAVRPLVTLLMAGAIIVGFFSGSVSADQFLPIATAPILFWFGSRAHKGE